jgi:phosphoribosylformylglycinamidine cyclo-ligase
MEEQGLTYAVDIAAADESVKKIQDHVKSTYDGNVLSSGETSFGGCYAFDPSAYSSPVLVSGTDGVGTKSEIAFLMNKYNTIGIDVVAANVDDIAAQGAKPLFFLDYVAVGVMDPDVMEQIVAGVAEGCRQANTALVGGEMSDHRELIEPGHFDISGTAIGVVERDRILPRDVQTGDIIMGIDSPGIRANGYTLVRDTFIKKAKRDLNEAAWLGADVTLGEELLRPSVVYSPAMQSMYQAGVNVHGCAHITGGGIAGNVVRALPKNVDAIIRRGSWSVPPIFSEIQREGNIAIDEMEKVFNLGIGYAVIVPESEVDAVQKICDEHSRSAYRIGDIADGDGKVLYV